MSRMLSYVAPEPMMAPAALGEEIIAEFAALAHLHADGWGTSWLDADTGAVRTAGGTEALDGPEQLKAVLSAPSSARLVYLRFASGGALPALEDIQPFLRGGIAFQHNGVITPREDALALLTEVERAELRGATDSEAYFAVVRHAQPDGAAWRETTVIARGVARVRSRFPGACLNAMILTGSGLHVVHAAGTAKVPLAAFAGRGADLEALPPGHDADYNTLRTTTNPSGVRIVATTGVDQRGWTRLADESVFLVTADGVAGVRL
ncbi:hypothetical protein [Microbacterium allomyrinae]|uniref:Glutamine amidotransferase type-2 domain-containing protein n=1 Tax=Microbacterium allomyrinae TaxID=2830666 RepID=A0A9X1S2A9_9MICO|nr:hypothetical protein [Microbacterium allomyrinae]MCC2032501.1 hypothetical protein [Microbacterium allomyrinae]